MEPQTNSVAEALGSRESVLLVLALLEREAGVEVLAARTGIATSTASRRLRDLALAGIVSRPRPRDPYAVTCPEPTRRLLEAMSEVASAILEARRAGEEQFRRRVKRTRLRAEYDRDAQEDQ